MTNNSLVIKIIHNFTRLGFLEHQGQDERLVAPVASGSGAGAVGGAGGAGAGAGGAGGGSSSGLQQLCLKPCCHDLNTRFSLNINNTIYAKATSFTITILMHQTK